MAKKILISVIFLFATSIFSMASDITGKWSGKVMDQFEVTYNFKVDGEKLTGNSTGPDGNLIEIKDGVIKGDDITFTIFVMETNLLVKGKVIGETIKLTFTMDGNEMSFDLAKVAQ